MVSRSGVATLPLHQGRVPRWLAERMARLGAAVTEAVILSEGRQGFLRRLSDPFWFQAFGAVLGMDWHSSGITTSVMGALKRGLNPKANDLGLHVCGGRGRHARQTPQELLTLAEKQGLDGNSLVRSSKLVAKVDNAAVQDGYSLYLHAFVVTDEGEWVVVQQGMCGETGLARRYHWRSESIDSFVEEPHDAVVGTNRGIIVNLTDHRAKRARTAAVELVELAPEKVAYELQRAVHQRHVQLPAHHEIRPTDVFLRRLQSVMAVAQEKGTDDFAELLLTPGLGPRTMQALALVAEVTHGAPSRFDDPARFAFAHGGKDGHPFPVPLRVYDQTIETLRTALNQARIGRPEKLHAFRRLENRARLLELCVKGPQFDEIVDDEWKKSTTFRGTTVMGPVNPMLEQRIRPKNKRKTKKNSSSKDCQLKLFKSEAL